MKQLFLFLTVIYHCNLCFAQNVGIGTTSPTERLHVVGNKALFQTNFLGIGTSTPTTAYTGFAMKNNVNSWYGMYVDAGTTGQPFYGYALNGTAAAYHQFNGTTQQYEYYHSNAGVPDFQIGNTQSAFPNTNFLGIGTTTPTTGFTGLTLKTAANNWYGMYIDAGATGQPFYGYALNGVAKAYSQFNGNNNTYEYYQSNPSTPDFQINGNTKAVFNTGFLGIGTSTPTTSYTGFAMKSAANTYYGSYVDAGPTGIPFYGYALNGTAVAYTTYNGANSRFEYHHTSDATPDFYLSNTQAVFPNTNFLGIGTSTPTTGFTGFAMKSAANTFYGSYIDAGPTGEPFYGYALNGVAKSYLSFDGPANSLEYHQTSDGTPDFFINGNTKAVFNTGFVGIGTSTPTTGFTGFAMKSTANTYYGSYVDAGPTGIPFYGYALNGVATAYTTYNGTTSRFEYHHTSDGTPDFAVSNTQALFPIQTFLGLGTSTPTTGTATGFTMKNNVNSWYGMYVDAGATGRPFYGYALNGTATAWTELNGSNNNWELNYGGVQLAVSSIGNLGVGTASPSQKLDVAGTIHSSNLNGGATSLSTDASGNIIRTPSDARLKKNISPINNALDKVLQMHGVTYNFIDVTRFGNNQQMGFLAQELEQVVPEAVSAGGEYKSVNYQVLTALLTEAMKEQQKQIEKQKQENGELKTIVQQLLKRIEDIDHIK